MVNLKIRRTVNLKIRRRVYLKNRRMMKMVNQKKGKSEEQENDENGDKVFYVMINGKKNLVKVVSEDVQD